MLQHEHALDTIGQNTGDWMELGPDLQRARRRLRLKMQWSKRDGPGIGHQNQHSNYCAVEGVVPDEIEHEFRLRRALMMEHFSTVSQPGFDNMAFARDAPMWLRPASECRPRSTYVVAHSDNHAAEDSAALSERSSREDTDAMSEYDDEDY